MFALQFEGIKPRYGAKVIDYGPAKEIETSGPTSLMGRSLVGRHGRHIEFNSVSTGEPLIEQYKIECGAERSSEFSLDLLNAKSENTMTAFVSKYGLPFNQIKFGNSFNNSILVSKAMRANKLMIDCHTFTLPRFLACEAGQWKLLDFMNQHIPQKSNETRIHWHLDQSGQLMPIILLKNPFTFALFEMFTARHYGRGIHTCPNCNEFFTAGKTANNKTKWCSPACRQSSYRKRKNL